MWQVVVCSRPTPAILVAPPKVVTVYLECHLSLSLPLFPALKFLLSSPLHLYFQSPLCTLLSSYSSDRTHFREHLLWEVCLPTWVEVGVPCVRAFQCHGRPVPIVLGSSPQAWELVGSDFVLPIFVSGASCPGSVISKMCPMFW